MSDVEFAIEYGFSTGGAFASRDSEWSPAISDEVTSVSSVLISDEMSEVSSIGVFNAPLRLSMVSGTDWTAGILSTVSTSVEF
jgi:hypothetical protein